MTKCRRLVAFLFLIWTITFSHSALAADNVWTGFIPASEDISKYAIAGVFGRVEHAITDPRAGTTILGPMFMIYNAAAMTLGGILLAYMLIMSTMNTANEGELLGRKWSSMYIPLRAAGGMSLLIPQASGYCLIQSIVMFTVLAGVGAADKVWDSALDYLKGGGTVLAQGTKGNKAASERYSAASEMTKVAANLLSYQACATAIRAVVTNGFVSVSPSVNKTGGSTVLNFPGNSSNNLEGACGTVTCPIGVSDSACISAVLAASFAFQSLAYSPVAGASVNKALVVAHIKNVALAMASTVIASKSPSTQNTDAFLTESKNFGWMSAGVYFYDMIKLDYKDNPSVSGKLEPTFAPSDNAVNLSSAASLTLTQKNEAEGYWKVIHDLLTTAADDAKEELKREKPEEDSAMSDPMAGGKFNDYSGLFSAIQDANWGGIGEFFPMLLTGGITQILGQVSADLSRMINQHGLWANPIVGIHRMGINVINGVTLAWILGGAVLFALGLASGWCNGKHPLMGALYMLLQQLLPVYTMIYVALFVVGAQFAYYVPMIPFIYFTYGVMGWLIGVIESMVAAPLIALGITHPEGHEMMGRAQPSVMLLVNIFMRPSLIIFGLLSGMMVCYLMFRFVNYGYFAAFSSMLNLNDSNVKLGNFIGNVAVFIFYVQFVTAIVSKSFSLIYDVPDKVLRWIGGHDQLGNARGGEEEMGRALASGAQRGASAMGSGGAGAKQTLEQEQDRSERAKERNAKTAGASGSTETTHTGKK